MSLINDALKRAHESQGKPPDAPPPLIPAASPSRGGLGWFGLALPAVIFLLLAAGAIFVWLAFAHKSSKPATAPIAAQVVSPAPQPLPAPVAANQSGATNAALPTNNNTVIELLPESWPKVQGIIYTQSHPIAIVNGKMVGVGDPVGQYRVKQITRYDVTFLGDDGSIKQLGIGQ